MATVPIVSKRLFTCLLANFYAHFHLHFNSLIFHNCKRLLGDALANTGVPYTGAMLLRYS